MALGLKISKTPAGLADQSSHPQLISFHTTNGSTVGTAHPGGTGGNTAGQTILVNFKGSDGTQYSDGFIVHQKGRKTFMVQSAGTPGTLTRCTLVESTSLSANQMYIKMAYQGGGAQLAYRISNRYVWTNASNPQRYPYLLGATAVVNYHQGTADTYFKNADGTTAATLFAIVEAI